MQANSSTATGSSTRRSQTSDTRGSRSSTSDPSSSRRRRDKVSNSTSTTSQKSTGKPNPNRGTSVPPDSEPPTHLFQDLSIGAPRPPQSKRHLYQKRQESNTRKQNSAVTGIRAASLPDHLHDTRLQERLEEEGLADIEEDDERVRIQRRIVSVAEAGTSKELRFTSLAVSTSRRSRESCSPGPSSEPQEEDIDELSSMSVSENNSFRTILAQELRALHDGTRSPKLMRSPPPPSRSPTSSPESVIFDNKEAEIIQPNSFLRPRFSVAYPEGQGLSLTLERSGVPTEGSSANPLLDSVDAAKPPSLPPHAYSSGIPLYGHAFPYGGLSDAPVVSPRPVRWVSPPKPVPALHGPLSIPYARCPSGADGEDYGGSLHAQDLVWPAYQERVFEGESALHPDYVARNHRSTRRDTRPAFIQQAIIEKEKERLQLEEQELKRRLDEEYRRLGQDHADHLWDSVNTLAGNPRDFQYKGGTPPTQQHDAGFSTFNHWTHSTTAPGSQNLHVPGMVTYSTHGYSLGVGNLIAPPRPFPSPIARHPDPERPGGASAMGLDPLPIFSPSNFTHYTSHNAAPGGPSPIGPVSPYSNDSYYSPCPPEPVVIPSFQEQSSIYVQPLGSSDGKLPSVANTVPLSQSGRTDRSRLMVRPIGAQEQDDGPTTLLAQDQRQAQAADASHRKSAPLPRLNSRRANVLQPITARLSMDYLRSTTAPGPQISPKPRRQTYAETLGKGLQVHPNFDGLPTPPGSSASDSASVSNQEKYEVLPPTPPALEPNALSLAWSEPLLEQLPNSWNTSDDGSAPLTTNSETTSTTNTREGRHRRRNRRKGNNAVLAGPL
ncbi:hypothetical protein FRC01_001875 [Tulasnella sp. 417]|nr:hypothetical protein FRC01_001875 [Tulasnella sp. 417]